MRFHFRVVRDSDVFEDCDAEARVGGRWGQGHNVMVSLSSERLATMHIHHTRCSGIASVDHYDSNSSDTAAGAACGLHLWCAPMYGGGVSRGASHGPTTRRAAPATAEDRTRHQDEWASTHSTSIPSLVGSCDALRENHDFPRRAP